MNFYFNKTEDLIDFLFNATEKDAVVRTNVFLDWEVVSLFIESRSGAQLSMNTKVISTSGTNEYLTWRKIRNLVNAFISENSILGSTIDIRLRFPPTLASELETTKEKYYEHFKLSFFSGADVIMVSNTASEIRIPAPYEPLENWTKYVGDLIDQWKKDRNES